MKNHFELLAPAGSFEILKAVISAGADAVYVGGCKFGARAYANNFSEEELLTAIDYVHLRGKKLFLTVNTLIKNHEIDELYSYLFPYYRQGLDGVIVQDFGAIKYIKEQFPQLAIHTSTQMTVTGVEGALLMKELGAERVVLARELSIKEMKEIHEQAAIELEAFIHGALCYSYSGQCLFSSILGGRSGNRGRCAQPCRLAYAVLDHNKKEYKKESYCISLKDLCGIEYLKALKEAGVYSLKIEGRMKQASYAAGVVSFYRKYIDLETQISKDDIKHLYELGNRCGFTTTYFDTNNGKDMITFEKPSYEKSNEALHKSIEEQYVANKNQLPIYGKLTIKKGQALQLYVYFNDVSITCSFGEAYEAKNKPIQEDDVLARMQKTGDSSFYFKELELSMDSDVFVPNGILNQLRREALSDLEEKILAVYRRTMNIEESKNVNHSNLKMNANQDSAKIIASYESREQLECILKREFITTVYGDSQQFQKNNFILQLKEDIQKVKKANKEFYFILPAIFRNKTAMFYENMVAKLQELDIDGFVVKNYEELYFVKKFFQNKCIVTDHNLYSFNDYSKKAFFEYEIQRDTLPLELNKKEIRNRNNKNSEMIIYGYYPLMVSAACVHKNSLQCDKIPQISYLKDRYQTNFPVKNHCSDCYNVIYNSLPTLLFSERKELTTFGISHFRISFTIESKKETNEILDLFEGKTKEASFTKGHYKRGVE